MLGYLYALSYHIFYIYNDFKLGFTNLVYICKIVMTKYYFIIIMNCNEF